MNNQKLFSNRELETTYVDIDASNPFLNGLAGWFWVVDITFLAWAYRVVSKAKEAGRLDDATDAKFRGLRAFARETFGDQCDGVPALAAKPVALPPIPAEFFSSSFQAAVGMAGEWPGYESDRLKWVPKDDEAAATETGTVYAAESKPSVRRRDHKPVKLSGPNLFV